MTRWAGPENPRSAVTTEQPTTRRVFWVRKAVDLTALALSGYSIEQSIEAANVPHTISFRQAIIMSDRSIAFSNIEWPNPEKGWRQVRATLAVTAAVVIKILQPRIANRLS